VFLFLVVVSAIVTLGFAQGLPPTGNLPSAPQTGVAPGGTPSLGDVLSSPTFETGVILGVGATVGVALLSLLFLGGTKFVNSENVLDSEARRQIFAYIRQHPGTHLRATAQALDLSTTNVLWHLRKLEGANLVNSRKFEGYKLFYPTEGGLDSRRRAIARSVLKNENARDILVHIADHPNTHQREIARVLGVNHGTIRWHLRKLNEAGLVVQLKKEHTSNYWLSEFGSRMLQESTGKSYPVPEVPYPAGIPLPANAAAVAAQGPAVAQAIGLAAGAAVPLVATASASKASVASAGDSPFGRAGVDDDADGVA
jgi:predicted transcriptional regulator